MIFSSDLMLMRALDKRDCLFQDYTVTVPCSGSINLTFLQNVTSPHVFCFDTAITITWEIEDECADSTDLLGIHYKISKENIEGGVAGPLTGYLLEFNRTIIPQNYGIGLAGKEYFGIFDATDVWCSLTLFRVPQPKLTNKLIFTAKNTQFFYDLTGITDNSYVELQNNFIIRQVIDYFFVTDSDYGVLDFYRGQFEDYIAPIGKVNEVAGGIEHRRFMAVGFRSMSSVHCIYTERKEDHYNAFLFARIHNLETRNCLFEHSVIDVKLLAAEDGKLTMVNNGTGPCAVILLNTFREKRIYLDEFWTDAVSSPIEVHNETALLFTFTKFDKVERYFLENNFYRIILPVGTSFTAIGHDNKSK
ncbi:hypothetical protein FO519_009607 [Halicephalobus sp. NKZ332]|nr:hypothetical protein FO519_009607 [Halicephalobus sp. NKZ332]